MWLRLNLSNAHFFCHTPRFRYESYSRWTSCFLSQCIEIIFDQTQVRQCLVMVHELSLQWPELVHALQLVRDGKPFRQVILAGRLVHPTHVKVLLGQLLVLKLFLRLRTFPTGLGWSGYRWRSRIIPAEFGNAWSCRPSTAGTWIIRDDFAFHKIKIAQSFIFFDFDKKFILKNVKKYIVRV